MPLPNRRSVRLPNFDYGGAGYYFLTGCSRDNAMCFGEIRNGIMCLYDLGALLWQQYERSFEMRPHFTDDAFVVMPNHWHALVGITRPWVPGAVEEKPRAEAFGKPVGDSVTAMLRGMLAAVTSAAKKMGYDDKIWQGRFYDHVVRNAEEYEHIRTYIWNNIAKWSDDRFYRS